MQAEIESVTSNGGWMVFAALVAVWIALIWEGRARKLSALLGAGKQEAVEARAKRKLTEAGGVANFRADLGKPAAAVEREKQPSQVSWPEPVA